MVYYENKNKKIYEYFFIPEQLQKHMLSVAAIALLLKNNWIGPRVDWNKIIKVLLIHDMGNIVKMEYEDYIIGFKDNINNQEKSKVYSFLLKRFGTNDHQLSLEISRAIGLSQIELQLLSEKIFNKNNETSSSNNIERKICAYADQRVSPEGVMPLKERLCEAKLRYRNKPGTSMNNSRTDSLIQHAFIIENQIMEYCSIKNIDINNKTISPFIPKLYNYLYDINDIKPIKCHFENVTAA